jgi:hypothetical protein
LITGHWQAQKKLFMLTKKFLIKIRQLKTKVLMPLTMMRPGYLSLLSCFILTGFSLNCMAQAEISAVRAGSKIDVYINNSLFTSYIFSQEEKYPFFFPVNGPSGASVTSMRNSNFPHHSSLFFGCDHVNGGNYWQEGPERGRIVSLREDIIENRGERVVIENECIWTRQGAVSPIRDFRKITISAPENDIFLIDFYVVLEMLEDVTIGRTNHSLFSARMDPDLAVVNGGTMINAEGETGEEGTFGKSSDWIDYHGKRMGKTEGLAIMQHPGNEWYPAPWFTRDYGFFSPTPMYWPADPQQGTFLKRGEKVHLRYRVVVHSGDHNEAGIEGYYQKFKTEEFK